VSKKMNTHSNPDEVAFVSGQDIRNQRETMGISLEEIKDRTKIGKFTLRLIEEDVYGSLPAPVYLKSFIKQISAIIGLDPQKTAEGYLARMEAEKNKEPTSHKTKNP